MKKEDPFITVLEFKRITDLLYGRAGIRMNESKQYILNSRVRRRMRILGLSSTDEYIRLLSKDETMEGEFQELVNLITVNETYFFRDFPQLESFSEGCLREIIAHKRKSGDIAIDVWSAGCSTGEEAYTVAIILHEMLADPSRWTIRILGSDIDRNVLRKAEKGEYDRRSLRDVPGEYLSKYFTPIGDGNFQVNDAIRRQVRFEHLNLMNAEAMRTREAYDFIFCRNVLIYFDDVSRKKVVDRFYVALNRPGFIFLGSSEAMGRITSAFAMKRVSNMIVYGKE